MAWLKCNSLAALLQQWTWQTLFPVSHAFICKCCSNKSCLCESLGNTTRRKQERMMTSITMTSSCTLEVSYGVWFSIVSPSQVMFVVQLPITGIAMLFSAGTFLYVATVHVLTELTHSHVHSSSEPNSTPSNSKLSKCELLLVIIGAFLPLGFSIIHHHWQYVVMNNFINDIGMRIWEWARG